MAGGRNQTLLFRSKLFTHPAHMDCVIAGAGDLQFNGARFWNVDSKLDHVDVKTRESVRDIDFLNYNNTPLVTCLTLGGIVKLYKLE